jgi:hypothetical protein
MANVWMRICVLNNKMVIASLPRHTINKTKWRLVCIYTYARNYYSFFSDFIIKNRQFLLYDTVFKNDVYGAESRRFYNNNNNNNNNNNIIIIIIIIIIMIMIIIIIIVIIIILIMIAEKNNSSLSYNNINNNNNNKINNYNIVDKNNYNDGNEE